MLIVHLLTGCYASREHRRWDNRDRKNYPDDYFYRVLKDTCHYQQSKVKLNFPYICERPDGSFHTYSFDKNKVAYSSPWVGEKPEFRQIIERQYPIGYYKICGDTLTIEEIASWKFFNMPWKFVHKKTLGLIANDTVKLSKDQLDIKQKNKFSAQADIYTLFTP